MRVLVCGGRDYKDRDRIYAVLDEVSLLGKPDCTIHGAYKGADQLADDWAIDRGVQPVRLPALWKFWGAGAGPKRNQNMIDLLAPDIVVAFPGGDGTADMVRRAELKARIKIIKVQS